VVVSYWRSVFGIGPRLCDCGAHHGARYGDAQGALCAGPRVKHAVHDSAAPRSRVFVGLLFFFQAEDGIRDWSVTGVQTCALPICRTRETARQCSIARKRALAAALGLVALAGTLSITRAADCPPEPQQHLPQAPPPPRSEERRVGKEGRARGRADEEETNEARGLGE